MVKGQRITWMEVIRRPMMVQSMVSWSMRSQKEASMPACQPARSCRQGVYCCWFRPLYIVIIASHYTTKEIYLSRR